MTVRPADYPPPWSVGEAFRPPTDPADERIEVGFLIVGAGPAGLAAAIRLGQLIEESPETAERLGDVPVAVLEKGKAPGSHLVSGAVVNPRALQRLFGDRKRLDELPFAGRVEAESVLFLTRRHAYRIPTPPTMANDHNWIVSLSKLGGWLAEEAESLGVAVLPETVAESLLVEGGRVLGVRTADRGRDRNGAALANFEAGSDVTARVTILAEGTQGHLTSAALERFGLQGESPQVWALAVKEVWRVPRPLGRVIHTMGWPLRGRAKYREFGGAFVYPLGEDLVTIGMVVGLDYRDAALSVHDLLQELKTHPRIRRILAGGERLQWGAKTIPEGGFVALPRRFHAPGLLLTGDGVGLVNVPALKGIHYAIESGRLAAEAAWRTLERGTSMRTALASYDDALRSSYVWRDLREVRNMRQAFGHGLVIGGGMAGAMTVSKGHFPPGDSRLERDVDHSLIRTNRDRLYPPADGKLTFDKLSSVFASGNRTRDDQPNHIRVQRRVPRELAEMWVRMCPAQVYEVGDADGDETVEVHLAPSNCVQCGAITAKGGRLTPPEGGSGPEYTLT
ncbi:MAG TPA: electron-transfer flavoprotein:ubiquinone oxidoreductase [Gaiellaceae bacterium]